MRVSSICYSAYQCRNNYVSPSFQAKAPVQQYVPLLKDNATTNRILKKAYSNVASWVKDRFTVSKIACINRLTDSARQMQRPDFSNLPLRKGEVKMEPVSPRRCPAQYMDGEVQGYNAKWKRVDNFQPYYGAYRDYYYELEYLEDKEYDSNGIKRRFGIGKNDGKKECTRYRMLYLNKNEEGKKILYGKKEPDLISKDEYYNIIDGKSVLSEEQYGMLYAGEDSQIMFVEPGDKDGKLQGWLRFIYHSHRVAPPGPCDY